FRSAPQKQPMPNIARARPSGNGGDKRFRFTKCNSGIGIRSARPGNASAADGIVIDFFVNMTTYSVRTIRLSGGGNPFHDHSDTGETIHVLCPAAALQWRDRRDHEFLIPNSLILNCSFARVRSPFSAPQ